MYLYIAGRAHSGSTILDVILGAGSAVESVGQIVAGMQTVGRRCACGLEMSACPFWTAVKHRFEAAGFDWVEAQCLGTWQTDVRRWPGTYLAPSSDPRRRRLAKVTEALARAVCETAGTPHLVDSSKEIARALFLLRWLPDAKVIHLVRDPRRVQQSHYWRMSGGHGFMYMGRKFKATWTAPLFHLLDICSWVVGNLLAEITCRVAPQRTIRVRYEDLCADPAGTVRRIMGALGVPLEDVARMLEAEESLVLRHSVAGNHIRYERAVRFAPDTEKARPNTPAWIGVVTVLVCWPMMLYYGYRPSGTLPPPLPGARRESSA